MRDRRGILRRLKLLDKLRGPNSKDLADVYAALDVSSRQLSLVRCIEVSSNGHRDYGILAQHTD